MKSLHKFLEEFAGPAGGATPGNTMGMGNPMAPEGDVPGSGDIPTAKAKRQKKKIKNGKILVKNN